MTRELGLQSELSLIGPTEKKMITTFTKQLFSTTLCFLLIIATTPSEAGAQQTGPPPGYSGQGAPLSANELQQLVAPIALYPDALVAQVLAAATFPDQVGSAANWLHQNQNLTGATLMQAVDHQQWDPSVKALTQFPSVLDNLAKNLSWTSSLGEAYGTQAADVMSAVQLLRAKAQAAGNLKSGAQIVVVQQSPQTIVIQSANPQVVYVPVYNPTVVYGYPYVIPGYSTAAVVTTGVIAFGVGVAVGVAMSGGHYGWGYSSWNCGWHGTTAVVYRGGAYYGNSAWHGGYYGSSARYSSGYNPSTGTYARGATVSNGYGSQSVGQAYNPRTGASATTQQGSNAKGAGEARRFRKTARLLTPSIKPPPKGPQGRCKLRTVARLLARRVSTTAPQRARPQMATSTLPPMATSTATRGAVGSKKAEARTVPRVGDSPKRAADHRLSAAEGEAGNLNLRVLVDRPAAAPAANERNALQSMFWRLGMSLEIRRVTVIRPLLALAPIILLAACSKSDKSSVSDTPSVKVFASFDDAGNGLLEAAKSGDKNAALAIFGPQSKEIIYSGDPVEDKAAVDKFVAAYGVMHRWRKMADGTQTLLVGADNFEFPIPLKQNGAGQWFFDTAAGKDEILMRRVGRNELAVIEVCGALAEAQAEYFSERHDEGSTQQYAVKFISDAGKQNGLYWESPEGQPKSPLGPLVALATDEGYSAKPDSHAPFHGYNFRLLTRQGSHAQGGAKDYVVDGKMVGGFAFVAYPAEYGNSGIMTFIINRDGVLFQMDLGKTTKEIATAMSEFDPDTGWKPVQD